MQREFRLLENIRSNEVEAEDVLSCSRKHLATIPTLYK